MTAPTITEAQGDDAQLYCYRHPDRETWVRCGRCDRPICTRCAMQGPVGVRCRQCGKPAFDPLTSFTPSQAVLGSATAILAGIVNGFIATRIGFFAIFVAYFGGGFIAEIVTRVTGYKRGPVMIGIMFGGIVLGTLLGALGGFWISYATLLGAASPGDLLLQPMLVDAATWALIAAGAACLGAWSRLR